MFGLIKRIFIGLLTDLAKGSNHTKCVSLSNHKRMIQPILINLRSNGYNQKFSYYSFVVRLGRGVRICNTLNDLYNEICISNKREDLNLSVITLITGINESKTLTKDILLECKGRFDGRKYNSDQWWNKRKCRCECKKRHVSEIFYVWNPATYNCENGQKWSKTYITISLHK